MLLSYVVNLSFSKYEGLLQWSRACDVRVGTGGPPLIQKSLTRFLLPKFFAYVHAIGGFSCL